MPTEGRIPIEKNITVTDEWGHQYKATWLRRAKGLVKSGRARWVDDHTIRLTHPPVHFSEDETMNDKYETRFDNDGKPVTDSHLQQSGEPAAYEEISRTQGAASGSIDERYILERIESIAAQTRLAHEALETLAQLDTTKSDGAAGGYGIQGKAEAIANVVQARETTNQQVLTLLDKIYTNKFMIKTFPKPQEASQKDPAERFEQVCKSLLQFKDEDGNYPEEIRETIKNIAERIFM